MKNTYAVFVDGDEYTCTQFFDVDTQQDGLDIKDALTQEHIGEMFGETIPDLDEMDVDEIEGFEARVTAFIEEKLNDGEKGYGYLNI